MGIFALFVRMKAAKKPTNALKIIMPPVFMSSGALMYIVPQFRLSLMEIGRGSCPWNAFFNITDKNL